MTLKDLSKNFMGDEEEVFWGIVEYEKETPINDELIDEIIKKCNDDDYLDLVTESFVDVYTSDLLNWYLENLSRISYADDYISDYSPDNFFGILQGGQFLYYQNLVHSVAKKILEILEV